MRKSLWLYFYYRWQEEQMPDIVGIKYVNTSIEWMIEYLFSEEVSDELFEDVISFVEIEE